MDIQEKIEYLENKVLVKIMDSIKNKTYYTIFDLYNPVKPVLSLNKFMDYLYENFIYIVDLEITRLTGIQHLQFKGLK